MEPYLNKGKCMQKKENFEEINRLFESGDRSENTMNLVWEANKGLIHHQIRKLANGRKLPPEIEREIYETGDMALLTAIMQYDAAKGVPFAGFASIVIRNDIKREFHDMVQDGRLYEESLEDIGDVEDEVSGSAEDQFFLTEECEERVKNICQWIDELKNVKKKDLWKKIFLGRLGLVNGTPETVNELKRVHKIKRSEIMKILARCKDLVMEKSGISRAEDNETKKEMLQPRDWHLLNYIIKCNSKAPAPDPENPLWKKDPYLGMDTTVLFPNREKILKDEVLSEYFFSVDTVSDAIKRLERIKNCKFEKIGRHQGFKILNPEEVTKITEKDLMISSVIYLLLKEYANTPYKKIFENMWKKFQESEGVIAEDMSFLEKEPLFVITDPLPKIDDKVFHKVYSACRKQKTIEFDYSSASSGDGTHVVDPYLVVSQKGSWYVLAWQHSSKDFRWFSFTRFASVPVVKGKYIPQENFNREDWLDLKQGILWSEESIKVKLLVHKELARFMSERVWFENQMESWYNDGTVVLEFETKHSVSPKFPQDLVRFIMNWSPHIEVLEPESLRNEVKNLALKVANYYK